MSKGKVAGKLKVVITTIVDVDDLDEYEAETIEEAAENAQKYLDNGDNSPYDYVDGYESCVVSVYRGK